jgi:opacity protein-like surface antigen
MKKLTTLAAALALGVSANAFAVTAQTGVYVGPFGGWAIPSKVLSNNDVNGYNSRSKTWTWGATLGYDYAINTNVMGGAEVSYINFGTTNYDSSPNTAPFGIKANGIQAMLTSTYVANNGVNAFVKAGGISEYTSLGQNAATSPNQPINMRKVVPAVAFGLGYMTAQNINVALQYERTFGQDYGPSNVNPTHPLAINAITLGLTYKFKA